MSARRNITVFSDIIQTSHEIAANNVASNLKNSLLGPKRSLAIVFMDYLNQVLYYDFLSASLKKLVIDVLKFFEIY